MTAVAATTTSRRLRRRVFFFMNCSSCFRSSLKWHATDGEDRFRLTDQWPPGVEFFVWAGPARPLHRTMRLECRRNPGSPPQVFWLRATSGRRRRTSPVSRRGALSSAVRALGYTKGGISRGQQLLEREAELEALEAAISAGSGRVLILEGAAGVGKSALLDVARDTGGRTGPPGSARPGQRAHAGRAVRGGGGALRRDASGRHAGPAGRGTVFRRWRARRLPVLARHGIPAGDRHGPEPADGPRPVLAAGEPDGAGSVPGGGGRHPLGRRAVAVLSALPRGTRRGTARDRPRRAPAGRRLDRWSADGPAAGVPRRPDSPAGAPVQGRDGRADPHPVLRPGRRRVLPGDVRRLAGQPVHRPGVGPDRRPGRGAPGGGIGRLRADAGAGIDRPGGAEPHLTAPAGRLGTGPGGGGPRQ